MPLPSWLSARGRADFDFASASAFAFEVKVEFEEIDQPCTNASANAKGNGGIARRRRSAKLVVQNGTVPRSRSGSAPVWLLHLQQHLLSLRL